MPAYPIGFCFAARQDCLSHKGFIVLLIFDWDGTLSNSAARIVDCFQRAAEAANVDVLETETIRNVIGLGLPEAVSQLYPMLKAIDRERLKEQYITFFLAADQTPSPLFDGVKEGLLTLKNAGYSMAVATGKSRRGLDRVLAHHDFANLFVATRCANETQSKPDPLMLEQLLEVCGAMPHEAIMVGDTEYDMAMAQAIAMPRVAVSYGVHSIDRLNVYDPLMCSDNFEQFVSWVQHQYPANIKLSINR